MRLEGHVERMINAISRNKHLIPGTRMEELAEKSQMQACAIKARLIDLLVDVRMRCSSDLHGKLVWLTDK